MVRLHCNVLFEIWYAMAWTSQYQSIFRPFIYWLNMRCLNRYKPFEGHLLDCLLILFQFHVPFHDSIQLYQFLNLSQVHLPFRHPHIFTASHHSWCSCQIFDLLFIILVILIYILTGCFLYILTYYHSNRIQTLEFLRSGLIQIIV